MGPQVKEFEAKLAEFGQADIALGCANGTDTLNLPVIGWKSPRRFRRLLPVLHLLRDGRSHRHHGGRSGFCGH